jgi:hypothetical protein
MQEIGSVFELTDAPVLATNFRSALYAIIEAKKPKRIWFPKYYCPSMTSPLQYDVEIKSGKACCKSIDLRPGDLVVVVNYFGFKNESFWEMKIPNDVIVVEDMSMSFYLGPNHRSDFWIYNLRKFFCLPDGAIIYGRDIKSLIVDKPSPEEWVNHNLSAMLLRSNGAEREKWYGESLAGKKLVPCGPYKMSDYSASKLGLIHDLTAPERRRINYRYLSESKIDSLFYPLKDEVPWGFPVFHKNAREVSKAMARDGVFVPVVWDDPILMLPCDQRYTPEDMQKVANVFAKNK